MQVEIGGGGTGGQRDVANATSGTLSTGGGGGGCGEGRPGGNGGSGIVVVRYQIGSVTSAKATGGSITSYAPDSITDGRKNRSYFS